MIIEKVPTEEKEKVSPMEKLAQTVEGHGYMEACKKLSVIPIGYYLRHIRDKSLVMQHRGLGDEGTKALCISLMVHNFVLFFIIYFRNFS